MAQQQMEFEIPLFGGNDFHLWLKSAVEEYHGVGCRCKDGDVEACYEALRVPTLTLLTTFRKANSVIENGIETRAEKASHVDVSVLNRDSDSWDARKFNPYGNTGIIKNTRYLLSHTVIEISNPLIHPVLYQNCVLN